MKRFKKPKVKKEKPFVVPTDYIMKVIMPCVMLACKDEFKIKDPDKLKQLSKRVQQNMNFISNDIISREELHELMEITDSSKATDYFDKVTADVRNKKEE